MNKRRLLKLADLLEADAENKKGIKFDLNDWGFGENYTPVEHACGTTACAVGLAIISGEFKRAGLYNYWGETGSTRIVPGYKDMRDWPAVRAFFGLGYEGAAFLFSADRYPTSKTTHAAGERYVAKRIRDFVAGKVSP